MVYPIPPGHVSRHILLLKPPATGSKHDKTLQCTPSNWTHRSGFARQPHAQAVPGRRTGLANQLEMQNQLPIPLAVAAALPHGQSAATSGKVCCSSTGRSPAQTRNREDKTNLDTKHRRYQTAPQLPQHGSATEPQPGEVPRAVEAARPLTTAALPTRATTAGREGRKEHNPPPPQAPTIPALWNHTLATTVRHAGQRLATRQKRNESHVPSLSQSHRTMKSGATKP